MQEDMTQLEIRSFASNSDPDMDNASDPRIGLNASRAIASELGSQAMPTPLLAEQIAANSSELAQVPELVETQVQEPKDTSEAEVALESALPSEPTDRPVHYIWKLISEDNRRSCYKPKNRLPPDFRADGPDGEAICKAACEANLECTAIALGTENGRYQNVPQKGKCTLFRRCAGKDGPERTIVFPDKEFRFEANTFLRERVEPEVSAEVSAASSDKCPPLGSPWAWKEIVNNKKTSCAKEGLIPDNGPKEKMTSDKCKAECFAHPACSHAHLVRDAGPRYSACTLFSSCPEETMRKVSYRGNVWSYCRPSA